MGRSTDIHNLPPYRGCLCSAVVGPQGGGGKTFRIHNLLPSFFISLIRKFKTPWDKSEQTVIFWKQIMPKMAWRSFSKSILTLLSQIWKCPSWTEYSSKKSRKNFTSTAKSVWSADSAISNIQDLRSRLVLLITYWSLLIPRIWTMRFQPQFLSWKVKQAKLGLPILLHHPNPALHSPVG